MAKAKKTEVATSTKKTKKVATKKPAAVKTVKSTGNKELDKMLAKMNEAKNKNNEQHPGLGKAPKKQGPKVNTKGFGGSSVVRRAGRGG